MGRGKTFLLSLAALSLILDPQRTSASPHETPRTSVLIIVPTPHLAHQIHRDLVLLSPDPSLISLVESPANNPFAPYPIVISTARTLTQSTLPHSFPTHTFIDEPMTLLAPLPPRHYPSYLLQDHPVNRHPPALVSVLDRLLLRNGSEDVMNAPRMTVWAGATGGSQLRRFVRSRGWIRSSDKVVNLDFTHPLPFSELSSSSAASLKSGTATGRLDRSSADTRLNPTSRVSHHAFLVHPISGSITSLDPSSSDRQVSPRTKRKANNTSPPSPADLSPLLLAIARLHLAAPPPRGSLSLVLPPEGTSLSSLSSSLASLGIASRVFTAQTGAQLHADSQYDHNAAPEAGSERQPFSTPVPVSPSHSLSSTPTTTTSPPHPTFLIAHRSSIPGIHLPSLHTIYLLSGLAAASPATTGSSQLSKARYKEKEEFYEVVVGRLGRLGSTMNGEGVRAASVNTRTAAGAGLGASSIHAGSGELHSDRGRKAGRVISLVLKDSGDEVALARMFSGEWARERGWELTEMKSD